MLKLLFAQVVSSNAMLLIAFGLVLSGYRPYYNPAESMRPTIEAYQYLMIKPPQYDDNGNIIVRRGDVIVFHKANDETRFIKRVIGLPNDRVQMVNGQIKLNGTLLPQRLIGQETINDAFGNEMQVTRWHETNLENRSYKIYNFYSNGPFDNTREIIVPPNSYFVMGDSRDNSTDSRMDVVLEAGLGFPEAENIVGVNGYKMGRIDNPDAFPPQEILSHIHWYEKAEKIE